MKPYQINDLERLTGVKAHTIRIWEKRYSLISPNRTDTNRRYYDDDQVKRLLNVTTLLAKGHKISKIAAYTDDEIHGFVQEITEDSDAASVATAFVNDLISCMLSFDEAGFEKVFSAAVLRMGLYMSMLDVVYPFLARVGLLWSVDKTAPMQEHFASCILRRKLLAAIDGLLPPQNNSKKFLLFLPPDEWHEVGLLFASYIIRSKGYTIVYLGQNVPVENMPKLVADVRPDFLLTFFVAARPEEEVFRLIDFYTKIDEKVRLLVAGSKQIVPDRKTKSDNISYLRSVESVNEWLM